MTEGEGLIPAVWVLTVRSPRYPMLIQQLAGSSVLLLKVYLKAYLSPYLCQRSCNGEPPKVGVSSMRVSATETECLTGSGSLNLGIEAVLNGKDPVFTWRNDGTGKL